MPGHSRPKNGVLSHAHVPGIQSFPLPVVKTWMAPTSPAMTIITAAPQGHEILNRVPIKHVLGTLERRKRRLESGFELGGELFRGPAFRAMDGLDRPRLVEQIDLVVADRENLPGDAGGRLRAKVDREWRDLFRRHALKSFDAAFVLLRLRRNRFDHARKGKGRDAVR